MGSLADRLAKLEQAIRVSLPQPVPARFKLLLRAMERRKAAARGVDTPPYTDEEAAELHKEDREMANGNGVVGHLAGSGGWEEDESRAFLDRLQDHARHRLRGGDAME